MHGRPRPTRRRRCFSSVHSSPMSSFHTSDYCGCIRSAMRRTPKSRDQKPPDAQRAEPFHATLKIAALPDHERTETKLPYQSAAIPARSQRRNHGQVTIAALASRIAEGVGLAMQGRIAVLHAAVVARANEFALASKIAAPIGMPPSASPLRASINATASIAEWSNSAMGRLYRGWQRDCLRRITESYLPAAVR
jgi:hypothetical protein